MASLHLFRSISAARKALTNKNHYLNKDDALLFIDDGVYPLSESQALPEQRVYALAEHLTARNINAVDTIFQISYEEFVDLTLKFNNIINWS
jgi:sulfur relay protein TusB/DsrH